MAHEIPYVATATVADLHDLEAKVEQRDELRGARYLHILVPCPLGWGSASHDTIRLARLARETGIFPVFEAEHGEVTRVTKIRHRVPVEEYLRPQKRFAHLFGDHGPSRHAGRAIQADADRNIRRFGLLEEEATHDDAQAVRDHARPGLVAGQQDRLVAHRAADLCRPLPPCNAQCPAGEDIQGWLFHAESGNYEAAWRHLTRDNPFPAIMGRVCYHTCESVCNRGQARRRRSASTRSSAFSATRRSKQGWRFALPETETGQARAGRRRRPVGHVGRVPPAPARAMPSR